MYRFHIVSPSALVLNLFLWVPLAIALLFGFGVLVFGWLCPPIAELCGWFCSKALYAMEACVQFAEPQPASHFWVAGPSVGLVLIFYTILFVGVGLHYLPRQRMFWAGLAFVVFAIGFVVPLDNDAAREESSVVQATFLSVGHGGCVVLTFPDGKTWLYDAGSLGATDTSTEKISSFLWSRGITRLEAIVLSHADIDHFNAVPGLLERFPVKRAIVSHAMFVSHDEAIAVLRKSLLSASVPIEVVAAGDNLSPNGQVVVSVLHPDGTLHADNDNANSLVLLIEHANKSLLLTGDLESEGLDRVLAEYKLNCDVALAPHHGSARSRPADFVRWCSPEYVVVSNGANSKSGAGPAEYAKAGCALFETCRYGSVTAKLSHQGVDVVPYLDAAAGVSLATCLD